MKSLALIAIAILLLVPQISSGINTSPLITQGNGSEHHESVEDHHNAKDSGGGHHGIRLASWRWEEYRMYIMCTVMILVAGILKLAFHHSGALAKYMPESCVLIVIGILIGVIMYYAFGEELNVFPQFTAELFFNCLLPPIILDSAYTLYDREFLSNIISVVLYAVLGTLFNVFAIGYGLYLLYYIGAMGEVHCTGHVVVENCTLDATSSIQFSSLISAVDPVAVLAIFEEIGVNMGLYFLVFGESLLNDGVTVVLYNSVSALATLGAEGPIEGLQYLMAVFSFFTVVFGGLSVGVLTGVFSAFVLKSTRDVRVIEPLIVITSAYFSFILAECIHWSGIISLIACGVTQKRYAFPNLSKKSYTTVKYGVKTLASFMDCIIFLFLGIVTISKTTKEGWHTGFILWTLVLCFVIRFIGVFSLTFLINKRRVNRISFKEQFIMAYGGLRGAVGFSLVTILPDDHPLKDMFLLTTLVVIFFTVFIQGGTIKFLVSKLRIARKSEEGKSMSKDINEITLDHVMSGVQSVTGFHSQHLVMEKIKSFDERFIKKYLIRDDAENSLALRLQKVTIDDHMARLYGPAVVAKSQVERYKSNGKGNNHGPYGAHKEKFVPMFNFANTLSQIPLSQERPHSPETTRQRWERDYEERMRHLEQKLSQSDVGSVMGMNRKANSVHVKRQYSQAKAAFKGIHRMTSVAFLPVVDAAETKSSDDKSPSCD